MKVFGAQYLKRPPPSKRAAEPPNKTEVDKWVWRPHDPGEVTRFRSNPRKLIRSWPHAALTNYRPSPEQQRVVLIFNLGTLNQTLVRWLRHFELSYFYLSFDQLA